EDSFHDEKIKARSFEAFKDEAPHDEGVIECSDSQDDEVIPLDSCLELQNKYSLKVSKDELQEVTKGIFVQELLDVVEVAEDLEMILDLLTHVMAIQGQYEVTSNPPFNIPTPHNRVEIRINL
ncbi:hypothetical protein KI387_012991, partial [Taxus chinensis]